MNVITHTSQPTQTAQARDWAAFLKVLVPAVANPPSAQDFAAKVAAIAFAMPGVPTDMLSERRQRDAMRRFKFFPGPAEIAEWLEPELKEQARFNQVMALPAPQPEIRGERTPEELAYAAAAMRQIKANLAEAREADLAATGKTGPTKAGHIAEEILLAQYEHEASKGGTFGNLARLRADAIRAKIGRMALEAGAERDGQQVTV